MTLAHANSEFVCKTSPSHTPGRGNKMYGLAGLNVGEQGLLGGKKICGRSCIYLDHINIKAHWSHKDYTVLRQRERIRLRSNSKHISREGEDSLCVKTSIYQLHVVGDSRKYESQEMF